MRSFRVIAGVVFTVATEVDDPPSFSTFDAFDLEVGGGGQVVLGTVSAVMESRWTGALAAATNLGSLSLRPRHVGVDRRRTVASAPLLDAQSTRDSN